MSIFAHSNSQNLVYRPCQPHHAINIHAERQKTLYPQLTLTFNMGQRACHLLFWLSVMARLYVTCPGLGNTRFI